MKWRKSDQGGGDRLALRIGDLARDHHWLMRLQGRRGKDRGKTYEGNSKGVFPHYLSPIPFAASIACRKVSYFSPRT